ncbi:putative zinc finger protein [Orchesella cincta]|uniref:Putative zinc finger protein n=1 Tax=Orchesella cincta TaxID=48709 RepID=A0A1D2MIR1_ORCCI|nr:putative zinc finger protein [Orchesella cincta]
MNTVNSIKKDAECPVCGKKFAKADSCMIHLRIHTGERPFKCSICGDTFALNSRLVRHSLSHSNKKQFQCEICPIGFNRPDALKRHVQAVHYKLRRHCCQLCGCRFAAISSAHSSQ